MKRLAISFNSIFNQLGLNQPKSLLGIETGEYAARKLIAPGLNQPKSLLGIETLRTVASASIQPGLNQPKSLLGIETSPQSSCLV